MRTTAFMDALDLAIEAEQKAHNFYMMLSEKVNDEELVKMIRGFAQEEKKHEEKLIGVKKGENFGPAIEDVGDLKIADYQKDPDVTPDMDLKELLTIASKAEKRAADLYAEMAAQFEEDTPEQNLFLQLVQEEKKHKLRIESFYEKEFMTEN